MCLWPRWLLWLRLAVVNIVSWEADAFQFRKRNANLMIVDWVSEFAPKNLQKALSYIIGSFTSVFEDTELKLTNRFLQAGFAS